MINYENLMISELIDSVEKNELFENISQTELFSFLINSKHEYLHVPSNEYIHCDILDRNYLALIIEGDVSVECVDADGNLLVLYSLSSSQCLGSLNIYDSFLTQSFYYKSTKKCKLFLLSTDSILSLYSSNSVIQQNYLRLMQNRISKLLNVITILHTDGVRQRFVKYMATIISPSSPSFVLPQTISNTADIIGVTRTSLYRELRKMRNENLIEIENQRITVNSELLENFKVHQNNQTRKVTLKKTANFARNYNGFDKFSVFSDLSSINIIGTKIAIPFSYNRIIYDEFDKPIDYVFISVNSCFTKEVALAKDKIIGKRATEIFPSIEASWIELFGRVAQTGTSEHLSNYSTALNGWFEIHAFSQTPGYFGVMCKNVTQDMVSNKKRNGRIKHLQHVVSQYRIINTIYRKALGAINHGLIFIDEYDIISFINDHANRLLGVCEKHVGQNFSELCSLSDITSGSIIYPTNGMSLCEIAKIRDCAHMKFRDRTQHFVALQHVKISATYSGVIIALVNSQIDHF